MLSRAQLFVTPWTAALQAPLSMRFSRQRYWSGLPFPSAGDLPNLGIEPWSLALQADSLPLSHLGNPDKESGEKAGGSKILDPRSVSQPWHLKAPSVKWASNGVKPLRLL